MIVTRDNVRAFLTKLLAMPVGPRGVLPWLPEAMDLAASLGMCLTCKGTGDELTPDGKVPCPACGGSALAKKPEPVLHQRRARTIRFTKLTDDQVREVHAAYDRGERQGPIAKRMGVSVALIHRIVTGKSYLHVATEVAIEQHRDEVLL